MAIMDYFLYEEPWFFKELNIANAFFAIFIGLFVISTLSKKRSHKEEGDIIT